MYIWAPKKNFKQTMSKNLLVPTDFSKVADCAVNHATAVAKTIDGKINLLHVVSKKDHMDEALLKMKLLTERLAKENPNVSYTPIIRVGNIFDDIAEVAEELKAELIIMGTHGMKGMQFITGSRALKVVTSSATPFIIVQERGIKDSGYDDIVVPLDMSKETKQKLAVVAIMAQYFKSRVHLIIPKESDEFIKNQITRNLNYAKQFFSEKKIEYTATVSDEDSGDFDDGIIRHASAINADLIAIMNLSANSLVAAFGSSYVQHIITNEAQIPALVINPISTSVMGSVLFS
jgi:nucleotide-binding universal stress UspA family protein